MRAQGNGDPQVCVQNLLRTVRGDVPFARLKGIDGRNIDVPETIASPAVIADAIWVIDTYEPRVDAQDVTTAALDSVYGDFTVSATVGDAVGTVEMDG
ncbi:MAG: early E1A protein [Peptococcaceae bacterium]|nr:early E1A protein [Peptococcaceae bacterium]